MAQDLLIRFLHYAIHSVVRRTEPLRALPFHLNTRRVTIRAPLEVHLRVTIRVPLRVAIRVILVLSRLSGS